MARFLADCHEGQYPRAAEYLNLRQTPISKRATVGPEQARELCAVLERTILIDLSKLSDQAEGDPNDGLPSGTDSLGAIETPSGTVELLIERVRQQGGSPIWKIASNTVGIIPVLYNEFGWGPLGKVLRRLLRDPLPRSDCGVDRPHHHRDRGVARVVGVPLRRGRHRARFSSPPRRRRSTCGLRSTSRTASPALVLVVFSAGTALWDSRCRSIASSSSPKGGAIAASPAPHGVPRHGLGAFRADRRPRPAHACLTTVPLVRRTIKLFVGTVAFIAALQNFGFNVTGIRPSRDRRPRHRPRGAEDRREPVRQRDLIADHRCWVGDVCRFNDVTARRGHRPPLDPLRTLDRTLVRCRTQFSNMALENLSRRDRPSPCRHHCAAARYSAEACASADRAPRDAREASQGGVNSIRTRFTRWTRSRSRSSCRLLCAPCAGTSFRRSPGARYSSARLRRG